MDQMKLGESSEKLHYVVNPHGGLQRRPLSPQQAGQPGLASSHCSASVSELMIGLASEADRLCDDGDDEAEQRQVRVERAKDEEEGRAGGKGADRSVDRV